MVIIWSNFAKNNLRDFATSTYMQHPKDYIKSLVNYVSILSEQNYLGNKLYSINNVEIRQLLYKKHRILYSINNNAVQILAVVHVIQDLTTTINYIKRFLQ